MELYNYFSLRELVSHIYTGEKIFDENVQFNSLKFNDDNNPLYIGGDNPEEKYTEFFDGKIDEVRIYNRPLSEEEIEEIANM